MKCPRCGAENPENFKFCGQCGSRLEQTRRCSCGAELPVEALFCPECGKRLGDNMHASIDGDVHKDGRVAIVNSCFYNPEVCNYYRVMSPQTAAALDFMKRSDDRDRSIIAIGIVNQFLEVGFFELGGGVLEAKYTLCTSVDDQTCFSLLYSQYQLLMEANPDCICCFGELDDNIEQIYQSICCAFGKQIPLENTNIRSGCSILNQVLTGSLRDILVLGAIGFDIWADCVDIHGKIESMTIVNKDTLLPTKSRFEIRNNVNKLTIYTGCRQLPQTIKVLETLDSKLLLELKSCQRESSSCLFFDVDANGRISLEYGI